MAWPSLPDISFELPELETSTKIILLIALAPGVIVSGFTFTFFTGFGSNPIAVAVSDLSTLATPPVIRVPTMDQPINITSPTQPYLPETSGDYVCYTYWYEWPANKIHTGVDWEPVMLVYNTNLNQSSPSLNGSPSLVAIISRFHQTTFSFGWVTRLSNFILNGTTPVVTFANVFAGQAYHIPITGSTTLVGVTARGNYTTIYTYTPIVDPSSPPSSGPNAYEAGAGPVDCFALYPTTANWLPAVIFGLLFGVITFAILTGIGLLSRFIWRLLHG